MQGKQKNKHKKFVFFPQLMVCPMLKKFYATQRFPHIKLVYKDKQSCFWPQAYYGKPDFDSTDF